MWLVDTSAWIELFRRSRPLSLAAMVPDPDLVVTCLPVIQEVLQGIDDDRYFAIARTSMYAWPRVDDPLGAEVIARRSRSTVSADGPVSPCGPPSTASLRPRPFATV